MDKMNVMMSDDIKLYIKIHCTKFFILFNVNYNTNIIRNHEKY